MHVDACTDVGYAPVDARDVACNTLNAGSAGSGRSRAADDHADGASASSVLATRDGAGRFLPGNREGRRGGPGSIIARKAWNKRKALHRAVTDESVERIAGRLVADAIAGDNEAARIVLEYTVGKPALPSEKVADGPRITFNITGPDDGRGSESAQGPTAGPLPPRTLDVDGRSESAQGPT